MMIIDTEVSMPKAKSSKEELYRDIYELGLTPKEGMLKYGYKDYNSFWAATKRRGLEYPHYIVGANHLSLEQRQVVLGTLLGDGSLTHSNGRNSSLRVSHCIAQEELLQRKMDILGKWVTPSSPREELHLGKVQMNFSTYTHPDFTELYHQFYPEGKKIVPSFIPDELRPLGLATWFMDDGSHMSKKRGIRFHVAGFPEESCWRLISLLSRWSVKAHLGKTSGGYCVLNVYGDESARFCKIVEPFMVPALRYKLDL